MAWPLSCKNASRCPPTRTAASAPPRCSALLGSHSRSPRVVVEEDAHPPRAHKLRFFDVRGPEYGPYSPWRFSLVDQQPASGLLDLGILVPSSAILPLAMLEPKYSMVSRLLCSLCALSVSPNRSPCSNYPAQLRIVMVLDQNSPTACMERRPVVFTVPLERRPKKTWGLLHEIQPRTALSKPMRRPEDT